MFKKLNCFFNHTGKRGSGRRSGDYCGLCYSSEEFELLRKINIERLNKS